MKKLMLLLLVFVTVFTSCAKNEGHSDAHADALTFTDDLGREVTVSGPDRVVTMIGSFADIWCLAGGKENLVASADDTWTQYDLSLNEDVKKIGSIKAPSLEVILSAEPDLIIASSKTGADVALMDTFEQMGIPVLYFSVSNFDEYLNMLGILTDITGKKDNYIKYGTDLQAEIERAKERADGSAPRVLYVRASGSSCRVKNSENSVLGEMLRDLGCINIADSETGLLDRLSMETIIKEDPDWIFAVLQGSVTAKAEKNLEKALLSDPAFETLTAVREGRFVMLDQRLYNMKPNARWAEAYTKLSEIIYGEQ